MENKAKPAIALNVPIHIRVRLFPGMEASDQDFVVPVLGIHAERLTVPFAHSVSGLAELCVRDDTGESGDYDFKYVDVHANIERSLIVTRFSVMPNDIRQNMTKFIYFG